MLEIINPVILPFLGSLIGALVALWISWSSRKNDMKKLIEDSLRKRKIELYDEFAKFLGECLFAMTYGKFEEEEFEKDMFIYNHRAMMWMSDSVLRAYIQYREKVRLANTSGTPDPNTTVMHYLTFIQTMRADCGHDNIGISPEKLAYILVRKKL